MNDGGKIIKNCIEYARQADIQKAIRYFKCMKNDAVVVIDDGFGTHPGENILDGEQEVQRMRPIDADKIDFNEVFVGASEFAQDTRNAAQMLIDKQPTVYDVDKIVDQLEEEQELAYADFDKYVEEVDPCLDSDCDDFFHKGLGRAIKVLKAGGKK